MNAQVIALVNQKGGVTKTTSCVNLGVGLAQAGKKVLLVDCDPQASLTISLGNPRPDELPVTLSNMMGKVLTDQPIVPGEGILHHSEGNDPAAVSGYGPPPIHPHPAGLPALPWYADRQCPCRR